MGVVQGAANGVSERDTTDSDELRRTVEPPVEELSDTALLDSDGEGGEGGSVGGWEELQLDYEELMDDADKMPGRVCQEDEVKVHATWEIEESSGEEGEIKDETDASTPHSQHTPKQGTPTDPHGNRGSAPSTTESESENANKEEGKEEEETAEGRQEEVSDHEKVPEVEATSGDSIPHRDTRVGPVCRHFLQGKCSWGKDCRFSHDERKLPPHLRPPAHQPRFPPPHFPPLHGPPPDRFLLHEDPLHRLGPDFMLPGTGAPHHPLPREGFDGSPLYMSYDSGAGRAGVVSQVAEESEGWYRLRTVAHHWSSDDDTGTPPDVQDLRDKLSSKVAEGSDQPPVRPSPSPDSHEEQRYKGKKKPRKAKREVRSSSPSSAEDLGLEVTRKKQRPKVHSVARDDSESICESVEAVSPSSRKTRKKRKHRSSSREDVGRDHHHHDDYVYPPPRHLPAPPHMHLHFPPHRHPPGPHDERFRPPDGLIPGYGPTPHGHFMDPYGPPHLPPRGHYSDHYSPLPYREWHGGIRSPPHPPRRQRSIPRSPSPKRGRHKRRKHNKATVSGSSESSPEPSHHHKHHRKKSSEHHSRTLDRKEKLLKELSVINEVIERKKQKKHSKTSTSPDT